MGTAEQDSDSRLGTKKRTLNPTNGPLSVFGSLARKLNTIVRAYLPARPTSSALMNRVKPAESIVGGTSGAAFLLANILCWAAVPVLLRYLTGHARRLDRQRVSLPLGIRTVLADFDRCLALRAPRPANPAALHRAFAVRAGRSGVVGLGPLLSARQRYRVLHAILVGLCLFRCNDFVSRRAEAARLAQVLCGADPVGGRLLF